LFFLLFFNNNFETISIVTATPQNEIINILKELKIYSYFDDVYGSPRNKIELLEQLIRKRKFDLKQALFIGDSINDYKAAQFHNILFALRKNNENLNIRDLKVYMFNHFDDFNFEELKNYS